MIQYQIEKIRIFDTASRGTSTNNVLIACEETENSTVTSATMFMQSPKVKTKFVTIMILKTCCFRFMTHKPMMIATSIPRKTNQAAGQRAKREAGEEIVEAARNSGIGYDFLQQRYEQQDQHRHREAHVSACG